MELSPQLVTALLLSPVGSPLGKNGLPWGLRHPFRDLQGAMLGWQNIGESCRALRLGLGHSASRTGGPGVRARLPPSGQPAPCPAPSLGELALRASFPPASGGLSPRPLQLLQLLLLAAAGSAGRAPKRLGRRGRGRGGAGGGEEEEPAEAEEVQRRGDALREQGLAAAALGDRTR